jgi:hypothetical protein
MCLDLPAPQFGSVIIADRKARWCEASQPTTGLLIASTDQVILHVKIAV